MDQRLSLITLGVGDVSWVQALGVWRCGGAAGDLRGPSLTVRSVAYGYMRYGLAARPVADSPAKLPASTVVTWLALLRNGMDPVNFALVPCAS